ncbi:hypothetical protein [Thalassomonas haliotis]|uniref:Uncharacterized protein n=1 Tax=Thalassomonas haliotis TaxID=485448 RepID=A0ABY7VF26_9GAMM|nr:hypothetical protein [Thalassomonas haliotis]WDE11605.1 hypothetical protein H3N35_25960 [Thalassomonas haliotis]
MSTAQDVAKQKGFFRWKNLRKIGKPYWKFTIGLLTALIACAWVYLCKIIWFSFKSDSLIDDHWLSDFIMQNILLFIVSYVLGSIYGGNYWDKKEAEYKEYLNKKSEDA